MMNNWHQCLGGEIPIRQRKAAWRECQKMELNGVSMTWVHEVANLVENDEPKKAIAEAREKLDVTGTYRFLAVLCVSSEEENMTKKKCKQCGDPIDNNNEEFCNLQCRVRWYKTQNQSGTTHD